MSPARVKEGGQRGFIVPIGGAERKIGDEEILKRFADLAGAGDALLAVIPTASEESDTGRRYEKIFRSIGAGGVAVLPFETRRECDDPGAGARRLACGRAARGRAVRAARAALRFARAVPRIRRP